MVADLFRRAAPIAVGAFVMAGAWGCGSSPTSPSTAPYSQSDVVVGTGTQAVAGSTVTMTYTGWLYDPSKPDNKGIQFDTSAGRDAFTFVLGAGQVIPGFDQGAVGMQVGGVRRLVIPPSLGYGTVRNGPIPPNATLVFVIGLDAVQ